MWETSIRVPLIVRCPGQQKTGAVVSDTVRNIDTFATVCGLLGVSAPADTRRSGQDFSPLIRGQTIPDWDQDVYGAYDLHNGGLAYMRMIRTPQYKLVRHLKARGMDELYDLKADPNETVNLMKSSQAVSIRNELDAKLRAWRQTIGDPVTDH
jgi:uncharacterized sulfatase